MHLLIPTLAIPKPTWWLSGASVDLDLANARYYDAGAGGEGQAVTTYLSCSRASTAYATNADGTLTSFSSNALRIGVGTGLLIEGSGTNVNTYSQDLSAGATHGDWNPSNITVGSTTTAPDGTNTAYNLTENSATGYHRLIRGLNFRSAAATGPHTVSVYLKNGSSNGRRYVGVHIINSTVDFRQSIVVDLVAGAITQTGTRGSPASPSWHLVTLANGWYRADITCTYTSGDGIELDVFASNSATPTLDAFALIQYTGDGVSNFYAWGFQIEQGAFPSSYITTPIDVNVTRAADNITIASTAQSNIAAATASIVAAVNSQGAAGVATNVVDSNGTNLLGYNSSNNALASMTATLATSNTGNRTTRDKLGLAWSGAGRSLVLNGGTVATDASAQTPSSTQHLGSTGSANFLNGYHERLSIFTSKIADATLQGFTT